MLTIEEIKNQGIKELNAELNIARKKYFELKIGLRTRHLKNSADAINCKKYIARMLTQLNHLKNNPNK